MRKIIELGVSDYLKEKESRVISTVKTSLGYELDDRKIKTAACDEARSFILGLEPIPNYRIILVSAMGSVEFWGGNKKSDAFTYNSIMGLHPSGLPLNLFDRFQHRLPKAWGLKTFVTKYDDAGNQIGGGNTFWEHDNRVPKEFFGKPFDVNNKKDPRMGFILASFWNPIMNRVEIVQTVSEFKLPSVCRRIDNGELIGISMACDVPFDRCGKCNHLSHNEKTYCDHLRDFRNRGIIDEYGDPYFMFNDYPVFFDNTLTERPAAIEGRMLQKVASLSTSFYFSDIPIFSDSFVYGNNYFEKKASDGLNDHEREVLSKTELNDIEIRRNLPNIILNNRPTGFDLSGYHEEPFSSETISKLRNYPIHSTLPIMGLLGINPSHSELAKLIFNVKDSEANKISQLAEMFYHKGNEYNNVDFLSDSIKDMDIEINIKIKKPEISNSLFDTILKIVNPYLPSKSYLPEFLFQRPYVKIIKTANQSNFINAEDNLQLLGKQAQAVLLARLLNEPELITNMTSLLKSAYVLSRLQDLGLDPNNIDLSFSPIRNGIQKQKLEGKKEFYSN